MAWKNDLTKEDLIKAGLNPDDLAEMKANGVKKADLEALKTELSTSLATSMAEQIKAGFAELDTKLVKPNNNNNSNNNNGGNDNNNVVVDDNDEMLANPAAYIKRQVGQGMMFSAVQSTKMRMELALDRAKSTLKGFKNAALTEEILTEWNQYKPEAFATNKDFNPDQLILKVHNMVMGNHIDEITRDTDKKEGKFNMVASGSGGGNFSTNSNSNNNNTDDKVTLTDIEKKQAARYGMTDEQWIAQNKEMAAEEQKVLARA